MVIEWLILVKTRSGLKSSFLGSYMVSVKSTACKHEHSGGSRLRDFRKPSPEDLSIEVKFSRR